MNHGQAELKHTETPGVGGGASMLLSVAGAGAGPGALVEHALLPVGTRPPFNVHQLHFTRRVPLLSHERSAGGDLGLGLREERALRDIEPPPRDDGLPEPLPRVPPLPPPPPAAAAAAAPNCSSPSLP